MQKPILYFLKYARDFTWSRRYVQHGIWTLARKITSFRFPEKVFVF